MSEISLTRLADDVAAILGEALSRDCHPEESPFPDFEDRVRILAPHLLAELIRASPDSALLQPVALTAECAINENGMATIPLPDDFLRLVAVKMSDWEKPATRLLTPYEPLFSRQFCEWAGIRGNQQRPVAVETFDVAAGGSGAKPRRVMQLFSSEKDAKPEYVLYLPVPQFHDDKMEIPDIFYGQLVISLAEKINSE